AVGTLTNQADVSGNENDPNPANNSLIQTTLVPSFVVDTTDDELTPGDGKTSLREAIAAANALAGQTITVAPPLLPSGAAAPTQLLNKDAQHRALELKANVTIVGPGAAALRIMGGGLLTDFSAFTLDAGVTATISGLTIAGAHVALNGGGIRNQGALTLTD